ncbi:hypothetical protein BHM03_00006276 [Ensete ventricosum]|nr:hypothetical protein BHM03_00006276 [Ensete ventricosum]
MGTHQGCVRSLPRVSGVCQDGAREFAERRLRLVGRLFGVAEKLVGSWDGLVMDVFEGIGKLARNMLRNHRRKIMRLVVGDFGGCRNAGVRSLSLVVKFDCNL